MQIFDPVYLIQFDCYERRDKPVYCVVMSGNWPDRLKQVALSNNILQTLMLATPMMRCSWSVIVMPCANPGV